VREYLTPKDLTEKGLAPVLDAMEVIDYTNSTLSKKQLLRTLWPDFPFEACFGKFIQKRGVCLQFLKEQCLLYITIVIIHFHRSEHCLRFLYHRLHSSGSSVMTYGEITQISNRALNRFLIMAPMCMVLQEVRSEFEGAAYV